MSGFFDLLRETEKREYLEKKIFQEETGNNEAKIGPLVPFTFRLGSFKSCLVIVCN